MRKVASNESSVPAALRCGRLAIAINNVCGAPKVLSECSKWSKMYVVQVDVKGSKELMKEAGLCQVGVARTNLTKSASARQPAAAGRARTRHGIFDISGSMELDGVRTSSCQPEYYRSSLCIADIVERRCVAPGSSRAILTCSRCHDIKGQPPPTSAKPLQLERQPSICSDSMALTRWARWCRRGGYVEGR